MNFKHIQTRNKSIASVIESYMRILFFPVFTLVCVICLFFQFANTLVMTNNTIKSESDSAAEHISWILKTYKSLVEDLGTTPFLTDPDVSTEEKISFLNKKSEEFGLLSCKTIRRDGFSDMDQNYRGNREYFQKALLGKTVISDPIISRDSGYIVIVVASPLWKNGKAGSNIEGVVYFSLEPGVLNQIVNELSISPNSSAYIISKESLIASSNEKDFQVGQPNHINQEINSRSQKKVADFERKAIAGNNKVDSFFCDGHLTSFASSPIYEMPDWFLIHKCPATDFFYLFYAYISFIVLLMVLSYFLISFHSKKIGISIAEPVQKMALRLQKASEGDFSSEVTSYGTLKEVRIISEATQSLVNRMNLVLNNDEFYTQDIKFSDLVNFEILNTFIKAYDKYMDAVLCIKDIDGNVIIGVPGVPNMPHTSQNIIINDRKAGSVEIYFTNISRYTSDDTQEIVDMLATSISKLAETNLYHHNHFISINENYKANIKSLMSENEKLTSSMQNWINELESSEFKNKKDFKLGTSMFAAQAREYLEILEDTKSFVDLSKLASDHIEADYSLDELSSSIIQNVRFSGDIKISVDKNTPDYLFGDRNALEKILLKLIQTIRIKDIDCPIFINFSTKKQLYSVILETEITFKSAIFTDDERSRLRAMFMSSNHLNQKSFWEQSVRKTLKLLHEIHGNATIIENDKELIVLTLDIPQLEADEGDRY